GLGAATLLGAGGLRRARRVAGTDGGARSVRGILGAGARLPLPGVAALAVSVLADARLRGRSRTRRAALCQRRTRGRSEEHTSELQSRENLVCRLLLEKKKT